MWIIKSQLVFSSDYLNKNRPHQIWKTQLLSLTDDQSWEGRALLHPDYGVRVGLHSHVTTQ